MKSFNHRTQIVLLICVLFLLFSATLPVSYAAPEATFNVDSHADKPDANPGDGLCATRRNECTLRAAVMEANANSNADTINLVGGVYGLTRAGKDTTAFKGDLDIQHALVIKTANPDKTVIDGNGIDRVITVMAFAQVTISGITIRDGSTTAGGGGVYNAGTLTLNDVDVVENVAGGSGGGIQNKQGFLAPGVLTLNNSTVSNNSAFQGGGIHNSRGTATVNVSTISENTAGSGGGISNLHGTMTITDSTVKDNVAEDTLGGGILNSEIAGGKSVMVINSSTINDNTADVGGGVFNSSHLRITNSTISGNTADLQGGGLSHFDGAAYLFNVTISDNTADVDGEGFGSGGGVFGASDASKLLNVRNSLIAGNFNYDAQNTAWVHEDCAGTLNSGGYNLIQNVLRDCELNGVTTGNILGQDPKLLPLQDNGGPTHTYGFFPDSPARNAGKPDGCRGWLGFILVTDQRGEPRHIGRGGRCDIGAYEFQQ